MAVTKIWPVRGRLDAPLNYISNPEKTKILEDVMNYAVNEEKTEKHFYVTGINCDSENARNEFIKVKKYFRKEDGIIAYHGYQSFMEGEVTPYEAHQIGIEFAKKVWGDDYQVVVATHLNTDCLHNHFVVNSVSFKDGYKLQKARWYDLSTISDEICKAHGISIVNDKTGKGLPKYMYEAEKEGKPTRLNMAKEAVDRAISLSLNMREFERNLNIQGYYLNINPNRKYWTIRQENWERPIRISRLGEEYANGRISERIRENDPNIRQNIDKYSKNNQKLHTNVEKYRQKSTNCRKISTKKPKNNTKRVSGLRGKYLYYCYLLKGFKKRKNPNRVHYLLRDDLLKLKNITEETKFLCEHNISYMEDLDKYKEELKKELSDLINFKSVVKNPDERKNINEDLRRIRHEIRLIERIEERSASITEKLSEVKMKENIKEREEKEHGI